MTVHSHSSSLISRNHTSPHIFYKTSRPWCSSQLSLSAAVSQLYLSPQPRCKPLDCSALFPTPLAINRCHPIIGSHHGLLLRNPKPTETWNQLFCATSSLFQAFAAWTATLSLGHAFEYLEEAATAFWGTKGEYLFCYMYFCVQKIILNTSTSPAAALPHRWVVKNHPQPT